MTSTLIHTAPTAATTTTTKAAAATSQRSVFSGWRKAPFTAEPWKRSLFLALSVPTAVVALFDGGRFQQRLAVSLLGRDVAATRLRGLASVPYNILMTVIVGYGWSIAFLNIAYPIRPLIGFPGYDPNSWGGPTYIGVWAFHGALGGLPFLFAMPLVLKAVAAAQQRFLGAR